MKSNVARSFDLGLQLAVAIGLCTYGGYYLDNKLNTMPLFLVLGLLLGATAGFLNVYKEVFSKDDKNDSSKKK